MELSPDLFCEKHKCKGYAHVIDDTTCGIRCPVKKSRQCSHSCSYTDCRDDKTGIENRRASICYRNGRGDEQRRYHSVGRTYRNHGENERSGYHRMGSSCRDGDHEKRTECHGGGNTDSHCRERCRCKEKSADSHNCRKYRWDKSRHHRSRSRRAYSSSSSGESDCRSTDSLFLNCNSTSKHHCGVEEAQKQRRKLNLVCRSHGCLQRSSTYVTECSYSQCCTGSLKPCCGAYYCHNRKRKHEHCSSDSDAGVSKVRRSDPVHPKHRHRCYWQQYVSPHDIYNGKSYRVSQCSPFRTVNPTKQCMKHVLNSPCAGHHVHSPDVCAIEHVEIPFGSKEVSSDTNRETNELWSHCAIGKVKFVNGQSENQEYKDEWLQLSLKAPQRLELKVEGVSKNDLKLSLPDDMVKLQMDDSIPSGLHKMGFHPSKESVKQIHENGFSVDFSHIDFPSRSAKMDAFSYHQPKENCHSLNFEQLPTSLPNLNTPERMTNILSGTAPGIQGKFSSGSGINFCYSPSREPQCTLLNRSNRDSLGMLGVENEEESPVSEPAILPNHEIGLSSNMINSTYKEGSRDLCLGDPHFPATSTSGAADCGIGTNVNAPQSFCLETIKELARSVIIINDSEDESSEQNCLGALHGKNNIPASRGNVSMSDEISGDDDSRDLVHGSKVSYVQDTLNPENVLVSEGRKFALEYTNTTLANKGREDEVENDVSLRISSSSQSRENVGEQVGSVIHLPDDKCRVVEVISSEDESVDNQMYNVTLLCKNETLNNREGYTLGVCVAAKGPDYMALTDEEDFDDDNHQSGNNFDKGHLLTGVRSHRKRKSCSAMDKGNIATIYSSNGISSTVDRKYIIPSGVESLLLISNSKPRMWDSGIICDLCGRGPSLMYGEWYAWCCGSRLFYCECTEEHKRKLKCSMKLNSKTKKPSKRWDGHEWSGKVHRMCALWSSEVFEKDDGRDQLEGLLNAVKRGRVLVCKDPLCRRFGATLGCRVKNCRRSFHYPCAERLASLLRCRMWEGFKRPVACHSHRHVDHDCATAKDWQLQVKWNYINNPGKAAKGSKTTAVYSEKLPCKDPNYLENIFRLDLNLDRDDQQTTKVTVGNMDYNQVPRGLSMALKEKAGSSAREGNEKLLDQIYDGNRTGKVGTTPSRTGQGTDTVRFLGNNLICDDISHGIEALRIPCTNDIDDMSIPSFQYITQSRFSEHATVILDSVMANMEKQAKVCKGCDELDMDNPEGSISAHIDVNDGRRDHDRRIDWQGELMLGRLPYNCYGLLQLGLQTIDVVECNSRCPCGPKCLNRELQKGLQVALEVFKTKDRGWGVRALGQIPRGKFVVEYVGEVLTQGEASKHGLVHDECSFSYLFNVDHPAVPQEDHLVVDGFKMSNVARFINHSCEGNLSIYRVYTETLDHRIFRIGLYACRDIELGEELTYDYKYIPTKEPGVSSDEPVAIKCSCQTKSCRQILLSARI